MAGKTLAAVSREAQDLITRGGQKRLKPHEYFGGTFSISNSVILGVSRFDATINQPQGTILSLGAPIDEYLPSVKGPRAAKLMIAKLTSYHRAIDRATGAQWLQAFKALLGSGADGRALTDSLPRVGGRGYRTIVR